MAKQVEQVKLIKQGLQEARQLTRENIINGFVL